jgi:hypothetical protein
MAQVQLEAFFLVQNACTAFPSTLVSMLELSPPLPILLLLRVAGLSGLNTIIVVAAVPSGLSLTPPKKIQNNEGGGEREESVYAYDLANVMRTNL